MEFLNNILLLKTSYYYRYYTNLTRNQTVEFQEYNIGN